MNARFAEIAEVLPSVRRYAQLLTGSPQRGDHYVRHFIDIVLADPGLVDGDDPKTQAFRVFHRACRGLAPAEEPTSSDAGGLPETASQEGQIRLLVSLTGFPRSIAAQMVDAGSERRPWEREDPICRHG